MKKGWVIATAVIVMLVGTAGLALMQDDEGVEVEPIISNVGIEIDRPQPITEIWGDFEVDGTANVPGMVAYQLEMIALDDAGEVPENAGWIPVTEPRTEVIVDDWLDTIRTTDIADGIYGLRLLVYVEVDGELVEPATYEVLPVRVNNDLFGVDDSGDDIIDLEEGEEPPPASEIPFPTEAGGSVLSAPVEQTAAVQVTPASSVEAVNIRGCDLQDNNRCPIVGSIPPGGVVDAIGLSANGSGWYLVQDAYGLQGWVSPSVVLINGDTTQLPLIAPPPPLAVSQPTPAAKVIPTNVAIQDGRAACGENFTVLVTVTNQGTAASQAGSVTLQDIHVPTGQVTYTGHASYPTLNPGQAYTAPVTVNTTTYYNQQHELRATNEGQTVYTRYTLEQGNCDKQPQKSPNTPPVQKKKKFKEGQCNLTLRKNATLYRKATGGKLGKVDNGTYMSDYARKYNNGSTRYRIYMEPGNKDSRVWVRSSQIEYRQKGCKI